MKRKYKIDPYGGHDKNIAVIGPGLRFFVDFDDVDHPAVRRAVKEMLHQLNSYDALAAEYAELRGRMDGLEK